jgi:hypothetical protein
LDHKTLAELIKMWCFLSSDIYLFTPLQGEPKTGVAHVLQNQKKPMTTVQSSKQMRGKNTELESEKKLRTD